MTICPMCDKEMTLAAGDIPFVNVERYGKVVRVMTTCCGTMVNLRAKTVFVAQVAYNQTDDDDWGYLAKKRK